MDKDGPDWTRTDLPHPRLISPRTLQLHSQMGVHLPVSLEDLGVPVVLLVQDPPEIRMTQMIPLSRVTLLTPAPSSSSYSLLISCPPQIPPESWHLRVVSITTLAS